MQDTIKLSITGISIAGAYTNGTGNYWLGSFFPSATISIHVTDTGATGLKTDSIRLRWKAPYGMLRN